MLIPLSGSVVRGAPSVGVPAVPLRDGSTAPREHEINAHHQRVWRPQDASEPVPYVLTLAGALEIGGWPVAAVPLAGLLAPTLGEIEWASDTPIPYLLADVAVAS